MEARGVKCEGKTQISPAEIQHRDTRRGGKDNLSGSCFVGIGCRHQHSPKNTNKQLEPSVMGNKIGCDQ